MVLEAQTLTAHCSAALFHKLRTLQQALIPKARVLTLHTAAKNDPTAAALEFDRELDKAKLITSTWGFPSLASQTWLHEEIDEVLQDAAAQAC